jgi:bifunctional non-homologous end joining protein LigD/DNA ligase-1
MKMLPKVPELTDIHKQVSARCILDGELIILVDGKPDFFEIQRRSLTTKEFKIKLQADRYPASFVAFDILYMNSEDLTALPLMERKERLLLAVEENDRLAVSRYVEGSGIDFYRLAEEQGLEGIVAKRQDSLYIFDKRTKDWIKIKNLQDDDFVIAGYIQKEKCVISVVLGQYDGSGLQNQGHVTLGVSTEDFKLMERETKLVASPFSEVSPWDEETVWIAPNLVCTVKYMMKTATGSMRQPVFKGIRFDKQPKDCRVDIITHKGNVFI